MTRVHSMSQCEPVGAAAAANLSILSRLPPLLQGVLAALAISFSAPTLAAFTVNGDGTVTDSETGLIWDRCTWGQTGADCSGDVATTHTWSQALGVAITANTANYKGHNDWRLPNRTELESLVDITRSSPAIDTAAFPNTPSTWYWSSTIYAPLPAVAWVVFFVNGSSGADFHDYLLHVRLVRSGQSFDALATRHAVSASASPGGGGSVNCSPNPVPDGGTTTCTATPATGYTFAGWSGACTGTGACAPSNVTGPISVTANFTPAAPAGPQSIPTLGTWGLMLLSGLLGLGAWAARRRRG